MTKSADAFRTISEVAAILDTPAHVLRFWESRFPQVKPVKRAGGRRYYRPADVALLGGIKALLHDDGLTIRGVQKLLKDLGTRHVAAMAVGVDASLEDDSAPESPTEADVSGGPEQRPHVAVPPIGVTPLTVEALDDTTKNDAVQPEGAQPEGAQPAPVTQPQTESTPNTNHGPADHAPAEAPPVAQADADDASSEDATDDAFAEIAKAIAPRPAPASNSPTTDTVGAEDASNGAVPLSTAEAIREAVTAHQAAQAPRPEMPREMSAPEAAAPTAATPTDSPADFAAQNIPTEDNIFDEAPMMIDAEEEPLEAEVIAFTAPRSASTPRPSPQLDLFAPADTTPSEPAATVDPATARPSPTPKRAAPIKRPQNTGFTAKTNAIRQLDPRQLSGAERAMAEDLFTRAQALQQRLQS